MMPGRARRSPSTDARLPSLRRCAARSRGTRCQKTKCGAGSEKGGGGGAMIRRVLVANRGEIALRIIRACHEEGLEAVAVYSEVDRLSPHVRAADRAVLLGPPAAPESYLDVAKLVAAAQETGCQAVHPGYGFLSERAPFAEAVVGAGL